MGKVKEWAMKQQEDVMDQFREGLINAKDCCTLLGATGMQPDDIESFIDENLQLNAAGKMVQFFANRT